MWVNRTAWEQVQRDLADLRLTMVKLETKVALFEATDVARAAALRDAAKLADRSERRERMRQQRAAAQDRDDDDLPDRVTVDALLDELEEDRDDG